MDSTARAGKSTQKNTDEGIKQFVGHVRDWSELTEDEQRTIQCPKLDQIKDDELSHETIYKDSWHELTDQQRESLTPKQEEGYFAQKEISWQDKHDETLVIHLLSCKTEKCQITLKAWKDNKYLTTKFERIRNMYETSNTSSCDVLDKSIEQINNEFPNWKDMPNEFNAAVLTWQDVYLELKSVMEKEPTRNQVIDMYDRVQKDLRNSVSEYMIEALQSHIDVEISQSGIATTEVSSQ